jgi:hypothetical protein
MEGQNNPAPDIGLGTGILAGMGAIIVFLLVSWAGFADKPAAKPGSAPVLRDS